MKAFILAGGGGTRLWPLSRALYPKQFLKIFGRYSLFQKTLKRLSGICSPYVMVVLTYKLIFLVLFIDLVYLFL
jgi:mannose-1-phosphate guanylyltransferase